MRLIWILVFGMLFFSIPMTTNAEGEKPFAQRECEKEMSELQIAYTTALKDGEISQNFYDAVNSLIEKTQETLTEESCVEVYETFVDAYQELLLRYPKEEMKHLKSFLEERNPEEQERKKTLYNADMRYIEKELKIYGKQMNLELSEEAFQELLSAVG